MAMTVFCQHLWHWIAPGRPFLLDHAARSARRAAHARPPAHPPPLWPPDWRRLPRTCKAHGWDVTLVRVLAVLGLLLLQWPGRRGLSGCLDRHSRGEPPISRCVSSSSMNGFYRDGRCKALDSPIGLGLRGGSSASQPARPRVLASPDYRARWNSRRRPRSARPRCFRSSAQRSRSAVSRAFQTLQCSRWSSSPPISRSPRPSPLSSAVFAGCSIGGYVTAGVLAQSPGAQSAVWPSFAPSRSPMPRPTLPSE